jgi:hypothetical protein
VGLLFPIFHRVLSSTLPIFELERQCARVAEAFKLKSRKQGSWSREAKAREAARESQAFHGMGKVLLKVRGLLERDGESSGDFKAT